MTMTQRRNSGSRKAPATTLTEDYGGRTIEASRNGEAWYVTIDGDEFGGSFADSATAMDAARAKVRKDRRSAEPQAKDFLMADVEATRQWLREALAERDGVRS
jgi:hypothetical protein